MSKIKGLIFDLDGVLVSTEKNHFNAWKAIADELNIKFNLQDNEKLKGLSRADSLNALLKMGNKNLPHFKFKNILALKNEIYLKSIENINQNDLLPGVLNFIQTKSKENYLLAVGSSSRNAHFILKKTGIFPYFKCIVDGNMVKNPKPDPEVFINASIGLNLNPKECLVFEDAYSGIMAAKNGNFKVIGVGNPEIKKHCHKFVGNLEEFDLTSYEKSI